MASRLDALPTVFTYNEAMVAGMSKHAFYQLRDEGVIEQVSRGIYRKTALEVSDMDFAELSTKIPIATICLGTALARHGLSDLIPSYLDMAIPRGKRAPLVTAPVAWHHFAPDTFGLGRDLIAAHDNRTVGIYNPQRTLVDVFRLRDREGSDVAYEALRRWLRRKGSSPGALLEMASRFPKAMPAIRHALEVLG